MSIFFDRFLCLCQERKTSPNAVAKQLSISSGSITAWKNGTYPRAETIQRLADYFHVSSDYLMGNVSEPYFYLDNGRIKNDLNSYEDKEKTPAPEGERKISDKDLIFALWGDTEDIDDADLEDVRRYAAFIKERKKKE